MIALRAIAGLLGFVPGWVYAIGIAALLATNCTTSLRLDKAKLNLAEQTAAIETAKAEAERQRADQERSYRAKESTWLKKLKENTDAADKKLAMVRENNLAAAGAGLRLRERTAELGKCPGESTAGTPAADASTPARSTADLLADVQRRLDAAADGIADFADRSRIAGKACERAYNEVSGP